MRRLHWSACRSRARCFGGVVSADGIVDPGRIVLGVGVGKLRLGMSEAAARRLLSPIGSSMLVTRLNRGQPNEFVEYQYPHPAKEYFVAYRVGFTGRPTTRRVSQIDISSPRNRTQQGVGRNTTLRRLLRTYPGLGCVQFFYPHQARRECRLGLRERRHTIFYVMGCTTYGSERNECPEAVLRIVIREPFVRVPLAP